MFFSKEVEIFARRLHSWYLEATRELSPESYNPKAQKDYDSLTEEQRFIDKYIAHKVINWYKSDEEKMK